MSTHYELYAKKQMEWTSVADQESIWVEPTTYGELRTMIRDAKTIMVQASINTGEDPYWDISDFTYIPVTKKFADSFYKGLNGYFSHDGGSTPQYRIDTKVLFLN